MDHKGVTSGTSELVRSGLLVSVFFAIVATITNFFKFFPPSSSLENW